MPIPKDYVAPTPISAKSRAYQQIREWIIDSTAPQSLAAEIAAPKITIEMIDRLESLNLNLKSALERHDFFASLKYDEQFHNTIIQIADNPYLETPLTNLMAHIRRQFFLSSISLSFESVEEHQDLINAFKKNNPEEAQKAAKRHWSRSVGDLLNQVHSNE